MDRDKQIELLKRARERRQAVAEALEKSAAFKAALSKYDSEAYAAEMKRA